MKKSVILISIAVLLLLCLAASCTKDNEVRETPVPTEIPVLTQTSEPTQDTSTPTPEPPDNKVCGYEFIPVGDVELSPDKITIPIDAKTFYSVAYLTLKQPDNFVISYRLNALPDTNYQQAGLYFNVGQDVWGKFMRSYADGVKFDFYGVAGTWDHEEGVSGATDDPFATAESVYMKLEAKNNVLSFFVSADGENWTLLENATRLFGDQFDIGFSGATFVADVTFEAVIDQIKIEYLN